MAVKVILANKPLDRKKTNGENWDFIENQKPADRMLSELTQETQSQSHWI